MGKKAQPKKTKAARSARKEPKGKPKKSRAAKPRPVKPGTAKRKTAARKPKTPLRAKKAAPARAKRKTAAAGEKRTRAVERLMAMKSAKPESPARKAKEGFLIKAPKKSKTENLIAGPRFVRNIAPTPRPAPPAPVPKPPAPSRKVVLRKKDLEELRQALLEERQRLIAQLAALDEIASLTGPSDVNENIPGYSIHLAEYATDNQVVETTLAQRTLQAERLAEIETALQRIEQPGYGICRNCNKPISMERLKIKPSAEFCVPCRELKEKGKL
ncbi:MAG: TraR/DksA C4-type zinc finger protein [Candidatus Sumerlaeia bacterium]|nr:TraR/DksA C4-type zinc finger protein [Candidatus Sumerlaeia bacterium]